MLHYNTDSHARKKMLLKLHQLKIKVHPDHLIDLYPLSLSSRDYYFYFKYLGFKKFNQDQIEKRSSMIFYF